MRKIIPSALLSAALIAATAFPATARFDHLRPEVERHLSKMGVSEEDVNKITILPRRQAGEANDAIVGYKATVSFHNREGHLTIMMNKIGVIKDVYSLRSGDFPGVPSY